MASDTKKLHKNRKLIDACRCSSSVGERHVENHNHKPKIKNEKMFQNKKMF
jgi:hypothetical protein